MVESVTRRVKNRKKRSVGRRERREQQERLQGQIDQAVRQVVCQAHERSLQAEVTELLGRAKSERRRLDDLTLVEACCNKCGTQYRQNFLRAGTYPRSLLSLDTLLELRVPRIRCVCGGVVDNEFLELEPYNRFWYDLEARGRELAGVCVSLRDAVQVLAWQTGQPISIATLNAQVNQTATLAAAFHQGRLERVPQVVMLDGIWLKVLLPTEETYVDKQGRKRKRMKLRKFPVLVAYGLDPTSGERWVIDWERGEGEDSASWQRLLERLLARGLAAEQGFKLFVHDGASGLEEAFGLVWFGEGVERQRCIFHKLKNVRRDVVGDDGMTTKERQERRRQVLSDAAKVYQGDTEETIRAELERFGQKWGEKEPKAVATLERDFDQTLTYLRVRDQARARGEEWRLECLRTTSPLERVQRHFRQKARQIVVAHSEAGLETAVYLVISHHHLAEPTYSTDWTTQLEEALLAV